MQALDNEDTMQEIKDQIAVKRTLISERASLRVKQYQQMAESMMQEIKKLENNEQLIDRS